MSCSAASTSAGTTRSCHVARGRTRFANAPRSCLVSIAAAAAAAPNGSRPPRVAVEGEPEFLGNPRRRSVPAIAIVADQLDDRWTVRCPIQLAGDREGGLAMAGCHQRGHRVAADPSIEPGVEGVHAEEEVDAP